MKRWAALTTVLYALALLLLTAPALMVVSLISFPSRAVERRLSPSGDDRQYLHLLGHMGRGKNMRFVRRPSNA